MGDKRVLIIYGGWQNSVYYIWVAKECLLYMDGKTVCIITGGKRVFVAGGKRVFIIEDGK